MNAVTINKLCFAYTTGCKHVLKDLSIGVPEASVTAILGPNGAGKTTLLYLILGLLKASSGTICLFEKPNNLYTGRSLKQLIGMVAQSEFIPFDLSVMEYVMLGRAPHLRLLQYPGHADITAAKEAINTVGLEKFSHRAVPLLSSGEKQLAAIARSLAQSPAILLFDEPTSHLDLANSRRILGMMKNSARSGKSVIFTTHDPNAAAAIADHVVLLGKERLIALGEMRDVLTRTNISDTYGEPVEVLQTNRGPVVLSLKE